MKFIFANKEKEIINITEPKIAKSISVASDDEIYFERVNYNQDKKRPVISKVVGEGPIERIFSTLSAFEKVYEQLLHSYFFLKLFNPAAAKDKSYNEITLSLDKHINRLRRTYDDLKKRTDVLKYVFETTEIDFDDYYIRLEELFEFHLGIDKDLKQYQKTYFRKIRMASISLFADKSYQDIEALTKLVNSQIKEYKHIEEAHDYIYYNSGELILNTVNTLVQAIENSGIKEYIKTYNFSYFLVSDFVMLLKFNEWIELFSKFIYIKKNINNIELFDYLSFKKLYEELERRYIIMLIYHEMITK